MARVRAFVPDDIPDVVALRRETFSQSHRSSASELAVYMKTMFLDGPWCDDALPSKVCEDSTGRVIGFLGVFPRWMQFDGAPLRVAVSTQLMVKPNNRGLTGFALLRDFYLGPQDLSFSDAATDVVRAICEQVGGRASLLYSICWTRPLRPWRYAASSIGGGVPQRALRAMARPLMRAGDAAAARLPNSWFHQAAPKTRRAELTTQAMVSLAPAMSREHALTACYDETLLDFALDSAARKSELGALQRVLVEDEAGRPIGWYVYYAAKDDIAHVLHVAAAPGSYGDVFDDLFYRAWKGGAIAARGRMIPKQLALLDAKRCLLGREGAWTIIQSRRPEILGAIERGDALFSRLDGEFWMSF